MDASASTSWKDRIRQERIRRNWRQQDLADQLGTTVVTIQRWERGSQQPSVYFRLKLCELFGKSAEELGLFPVTDPEDNKLASSPVEMQPASEDRSRAEELPAGDDIPHAESVVMSSPSDSLKQQDRQTRPVSLKRRRLLAGLSVGALIGATGGLALYFSRIASAPVPGTTLFTYGGHSAVVRAVAWSPEGQRIASAGDDQTVQVWTVSPQAGSVQQIYRQHHNAVNAVGWSPDGKWIASAAQDAHIWDVVTGQRRLLYRRHTSLVSSMAWSPNGQYLASGSHDKSVHIWDAITGILQIGPLEHQDLVNSVSWSPDGRYLASGSADGTVHIWDAHSGQLLQTYHGYGLQVNTVAFSADGQYLASGGGDQTLHIWKPLLEQESFHISLSSKVRAVAWSPRGLLVTVACADGTVSIVDEATARIQLSYNGHRGAVQAVAWSQDGARIASGSSDMTVRIWQAT